MKKYCSRFPSVLRDAFRESKVVIPCSNETWCVNYIYVAMEAYRAIDVNDDKQNITQYDFESRVERDIREGKFESLPKKLTLYSCSCFFTEQKLLEKVTNLKNKIIKGESKIAKGTLKFRNGPILVNKDTGHIDSFLFEKADVVGDFKFV